MATAAEQTMRNGEICAAHAAGATVAELETRFTLKKSRIKEIVAAGMPAETTMPSGIKLAEARMNDYRDLLDEARSFATTIPETQPAAKVGAFRLICDMLGQLTSLEQKLGYLPRDLAELGHKREFAETVAGILVEHEVSAAARQALLEALGEDRWAA